MTGESITFHEVAKLVRQGVNPEDVGDVPYVGLEHIEEGTLRLLGVGNSKNVTSTKFRFSKGDILFGKLRPYFRKVIRPNFDGICSTDIWVVRSEQGIDQGYLFYWMAANDFVAFATQGSEGTKMPRAKWEHVGRFPRKRLGKTEQRAIAYILGSLDNKIKLNRRINETLEAMASAIFKSWFVDFDPVRAKAEGRDIGLPDEIAKLFPDSFEDSELGEIPKGWKSRSLYDSAKYINGAAYRGFYFTDEEGAVPVVKIAELKNGVTSQTKFTKTELDDKYRIGDGEILLSWSGNPDTSIGTFVWCGGAAWLNQHIFRVLPHQEIEKCFVFYLLKYLRPVLAEIARDKQTTGLGHFTSRDMKRLTVIYPPENILTIFNDFVGPMFDRWYGNLFESNTLASLRDTLLPKLISGELRVPDAKKFVEEAGV